MQRVSKHRSESRTKTLGNLPDLPGRRLLVGVVVLIALLLIVALVSACSDSTPTAQQREGAARQSSYNRLTSAQPAHTMNYSPSRDTINFWIDTWGKNPNKLSYVYLMDAQGDLVGYYIFKGLPVSYCAALTPTYQRLDAGGDSSTADAIVPAPGVDGVFYSGGQCAAYYGKDAVSGSYIEYTAGMGISPLIYDKPLPRQDVKPLGFATTENVK